MRKIWKEFKSFALSGSMLDLALGFIIGTAFAAVVDSATKNLLNPLIGAIFGQRNLATLKWKVHGSPVAYGSFIQDAVTFFLFALMLFLILKVIGAIGVGRTRVFEERQCPYCLEYVNPEALICRTCRLPLVDKLPELDEAEARAAKMRARHHLKIDLPVIDLPDLKEIPVPRRRKGGTATKPIALIPVIPVVAAEVTEVDTDG